MILEVPHFLFIRGKGKNHNKQFILRTSVFTADFKLLINALIYTHGAPHHFPSSSGEATSPVSDDGEALI